jgi:hypothetical protein
MTRKLLLATLWLAAAASMAPSVSSAAVLIIEQAPPAPRVEVIPGPRAGFVWAPGYWAWRGREHVWVTGHWVRERRGYHWVPDAWAADGPRYRFIRGHWEH